MNFLGIDVGTGGTRALVIDPAGRIVGSATTRARPLRHAATGLGRTGPGGLVARDGRSRPRRPGRRRASTAPASRPWAFPARCTVRRCSTTQDQVVRPALLWCDQRTGAECDGDHRHGRRRPPDRADAQPGPHRLHAAQAAVGAAPRARALGARPIGAAAQGLRPLPPDRRPRHRRRRRLGHAALRRRQPPLVGRGRRRPRHRSRAAAARLRVAGGDRHGERRGRRGHRPARRARRSSPAAAIRRPARSAWASSKPGSSARRSARRASSSPRRPSRRSIRRAASTPSATPCPACGTSWASPRARACRCAGCAT